MGAVGTALPPKDDWLQRLIALGLRMGIGKKELLCDYYPDELPALFAAYAEGIATDADKDDQSDPMAFFGGGGEQIGVGGDMDGAG